MSARRVAEPAAIGLALVVFGYLGWDAALWDARLQLLLHVCALVAVVVLAVLADRGLRLPRTRIDLLVLLVIVAFGVAALAGQNVGLAARALLAVIGTAAMLPIALVALRHRASATALAATVPILLLAAGALAVMLPRRLAWYAADGPGLVPPARLGGDGSPFGSVAVAPFVLLAALALTLLIEHRGLRRTIALATVAVAVPLTAFSGSRAAWVAIGIASAFMLVPFVGRLRPRRPTPGGILLGAAAGVVIVGVVLTALPRLTAFTSIIYRGYLWRDTLAAWAEHPLLGVGPGTMSYARQVAAPPLSFPVRQPHSHNLALGVLGDAGVVGLVAAGALVVAFFWVAGPWRQRRAAGRAAASVLAGFLVAGLFDDMTFLPGFNLLVLLLAATALLGAGAVRWARVPHRPLLAAGLAAATAAAVVVMTIGDLSGALYRNGIDAFSAGQPAAANGWLVRAERLDPWHPANPKALAVTASWLGDAAASRAASERALARNPGDGPTWTNLAVACARLGDDRCAESAARRAIDRAQPTSLELINAAVLHDAVARRDEADGAYRLSLLTNRATGLDHPWPRLVELTGLTPPELSREALAMNRLLALRTQGLPIDPADFADDPTASALASAMVGDEDAAREALARAETVAAGSIATWDVSALLATEWGEDPSRALRLAELLRGEPTATTPNELVAEARDIGDFRAYPADGFSAWAVRLLLDPPWPWILDDLVPGAETARR